MVGYAFEEAVASLRRSGRSALVSIGTIAIAFVTLGGFLLLSVNVQGVLDRWLAAAEISVYFHDAAGAGDHAAVEALLREQPGVEAIEFVSKAQALERFRADFPELSDVTGSLEQNPFPAAFEVRLRAGAGDADAEAVAGALAGQPGVADVRFDRQWLARLLGVVTAARLAGGVVAGILLLGAAFTVGAVVRLSLHTRRDEIEIMSLVGAPLSYIRGPFVCEGLLLGGLGAGAALAVVGGLYVLLGQWLGPDLAGLTGTGHLTFLGAREIITIVLGGLLVGALAGTFASRAAR